MADETLILDAEIQLSSEKAYKDADKAITKIQKKISDNPAEIEVLVKDTRSVLSSLTPLKKALKKEMDKINTEITRVNITSSSSGADVKYVEELTQKAKGLGDVYSKISSYQSQLRGKMDKLIAPINAQRKEAESMQLAFDKSVKSLTGAIKGGSIDAVMANLKQGLGVTEKSLKDAIVYSKEYADTFGLPIEKIQQQEQLLKSLQYQLALVTKQNKLASAEYQKLATEIQGGKTYDIGTSTPLSELTEQLKMSKLIQSELERTSSEYAKHKAFQESITNAIRKQSEAEVSSMDESTMEARNAKIKEYKRLLEGVNDTTTEGKRIQKQYNKTIADLAALNKAAQSRSNTTKEEAALNRQITSILSGRATTENKITAAIQARKKEQQDLVIGSDKYWANLQQIEALEKKLPNHIRNANDQLKNQSNTLQQLKGMLDDYVGVYAAIRSIKAVVETTAQFELQKVALNALTGSLIETERIWGLIAAKSVKSPFRLKALVTYTKQLAAYNIESDKLFETTSQLGDISAGLGVSLDRLILAYGQVKAATVLRGTELRQFTEAGLDLLPQLAQKFTELTGTMTSTADIFDLISKRAVPFEMIKEIFDDMTSSGGRFYNMQEIQAKTMQGSLTNLIDRLDLFKQSIGEANSSMIKFFIEGADSALEFLTANSALANGLVTLAATIGGYKAVMAARMVIQRRYNTAVKEELLLNKLNTASMKKNGVEITKVTLAKNRQRIVTDKLTKSEFVNTAMTDKASKAQALYMWNTYRASTATNVFSKSLYKLRAAFAANPLTIILVAVTAIASGIWSWVDASNKATEKMAKMTAEFNKLREERKKWSDIVLKFDVSTESGKNDAVKALKEYIKELEKQKIVIPVSIGSLGNLDSEELQKEIKRIMKYAEEYAAAGERFQRRQQRDDNLTDLVKDAQDGYGELLSTVNTANDALMAREQELWVDSGDIRKQNIKEQEEAIDALGQAYSKADANSKASILREKQSRENALSILKQEEISLERIVNLRKSLTKEEGESNEQYIMRAARIFDTLDVEGMLGKYGSSIQNQFVDAVDDIQSGVLEDYVQDTKEAIDELRKAISETVATSSGDSTSVVSGIESVLNLSGLSKEELKPLVLELEEKLQIDLFPEIKDPDESDLKIWQQNVNDTINKVGAIEVEVEGKVKTHYDNKDARDEYKKMLINSTESALTPEQFEEQYVKEWQNIADRLNKISKGVKPFGWGYGKETTKALLAYYEEGAKKLGFSLDKVTGKSRKGDSGWLQSLKTEYSEVKEIYEKYKSLTKEVGSIEARKQIEEMYGGFININFLDPDKYKKRIESILNKIGTFSSSFKSATDIISRADGDASSELLENTQLWSNEYEARLRQLEGFRAEAYRVNGSGNWTIGYGIERGGNVKEGDTITKEEADKELREDLAMRSKAISKIINESFSGLTLNQSQFDVLLDLSFNAGIGSVESVLKSAAGSYEKVGEILKTYGTTQASTGKKMEGLINRANERSTIWAESMTGDTAQSLYKVLDAAEKQLKSDALSFASQLKRAIIGTDFSEAEQAIKDKIAKLNDEIKKQQTASDFYDKVLGLTGNQDLAMAVSVSIYGDFGDVSKKLQEQLKAAFQVDGLEGDLAKSVNKAIETLDIKDLQSLSAKLFGDEKMGKEAYAQIQKIIADIQKSTADSSLNLLKEATDTKDFDVRRKVVIAKYEQLMKDLEQSTEFTPFEKIEMGKTYTTNKNQELGQISLDEIKMNQLYISTFGDIENTATESIGRVREMLLALRNDSNLSAEALKELNSQLLKLDDLELDRSTTPLKDLRKDIKQANEELAILEISLSAYQALLSGEKAESESIEDKSSDEYLESQARIAQYEKDILDTNDKIMAKKNEIKKLGSQEISIIQKQYQKWAGIMKSTSSVARSVASIGVSSGLWDEGVTEDIEATADVLDTVVDGVQNYITQIASVADGAAEGMSLTAVLASQSIKSVEKASVILTIISIAFQIAMAIIDAIAGSKRRKIDEAIESQQSKVDELSRSYDKLGDAAEKAFGKDKIALMKEQDKALQNQINAYEEMIALENQRKDSERDDEQIKEWENEQEDLREQLKDTGEYFEAYLGTTATDAMTALKDAWYELWQDMESTPLQRMEAMKNAWRDMIRNMIMEQMAMGIIEAQFGDFFDRMAQRIKDSGGVLSEAEIEGLFNEGLGLIDGIAPQLELIGDYMDKIGVANKEIESSDLSGLSQGVATATSEEVTTVAGYMSSALQYGVMIHSILDRWEKQGYSGVSVAGVDNSAQTNTLLTAIADNTSRSAKSVEAIELLLEKVTTPIGTDKGVSLNVDVVN